MTIPKSARLATELHCLSDDRTQVITIQRWDSPTGKACWLRALRNGRRVRDARYALPADAAELEQDLARMRQRFTEGALDEDEAWRMLHELAGVERQPCQRRDVCGGRMVLGWPYCPACGAHERRVASGAMSGVRGRMLPQPVRFTALK